MHVCIEHGIKTKHAHFYIDDLNRSIAYLCTNQIIVYFGFCNNSIDCMFFVKLWLACFLFHTCLFHCNKVTFVNYFMTIFFRYKFKTLLTKFFILLLQTSIKIVLKFQELFLWIQLSIKLDSMNWFSPKKISTKLVSTKITIFSAFYEL